MKTKLQPALRIWTLSAVLVLVGICGARANKENDTLEADLELQKSNVLVAEPLVVRVVLRNAGSEGVATPYSNARALRITAALRVEIRKGTETLMTTWAKSTGAGLIAPRGGNILPPGGSVSEEKTFCLRTTAADGSSKWLEPGTYQVRATLQLQGRDKSLETAEQTLRVMPLPPSAAGLLRVISPDDACFLEGSHLKPTVEQAEAAKELKARFPELPHRQYYEYQVLRGLEEDLAKYRPAAKAYIEEFPKSPYMDDVLWNLARIEREADEYDKAAAHLETLLRDYPDSPLKQEAEEKLKEAQERAAARKTAKEKEAAEEKAVPSQEKPAPAPDARP
jgi:tetratricopeptide (TPR) repeat protein